MNKNTTFFDRPRSVDEVAEYMDSSRNFIIEQIHSGNLRAIKVGRKFCRVLPEDLQTWLAKHATLQDA